MHHLQVCVQLEMPATHTIFPKVERWLDDSDHQASLDLTAKRKDVTRYRSIIDFLYAELHPQWKPACFRYYDDEGPPLKELITAKQRKVMEATMLVFLEVSYAHYCAKRVRSWAGTVSDMKKLIAA